MREHLHTLCLSPTRPSTPPNSPPPHTHTHTHTPLSNMHPFNLLLLCLCLLLLLLFLTYQSYSGWAWQGHDCCWGVEVIEFLSQSDSRQHRQFRHSQARRNRQGWASPWLRTTINDRGTQTLEAPKKKLVVGREERKKKNEMNVMQHSPQFYSPRIHGSKTHVSLEQLQGGEGLFFASCFLREALNWPGLGVVNFPTFFSFFFIFVSCAVPDRGVSGRLVAAIHWQKPGESLLIFPQVSGATRTRWFKTSVGPFNSATRLYAAHAVPCHIYFVFGTFNWCFTLQLPWKESPTSSRVEVKKTKQNTTHLISFLKCFGILVTSPPVNIQLIGAFWGDFRQINLPVRY